MKQNLQAGAAILLVFVLLGGLAYAFTGLVRGTVIADIDRDRAICTKQGMQSLLVNEPASYMHGNTGPHVLCIERKVLN